MVEVVTREEFDKFKKFICERLDKMEERTKKRLKAIAEEFDEENNVIQEMMNDIEGKIKSFFIRIEEAAQAVLE